MTRIISNLTVIRLPAKTRELAKLAERNMRLTCTIQDRHVWLENDEGSVGIALETLKGPVEHEADKGAGIPGIASSRCFSQ